MFQECHFHWSLVIEQVRSNNGLLAIGCVRPLFMPSCKSSCPRCQVAKLSWWMLQGPNDKVGVAMMKREPANVNWSAFRQQMGRKSTSGIEIKSNSTSEFVASQ